MLLMTDIANNRARYDGAILVGDPPTTELDVELDSFTPAKMAELRAIAAKYALQNEVQLNLKKAQLPLFEDTTTP
jgi:hypothetical protein